MHGVKETYTLILLSDANILIDLYVVDGLSVISKVAAVEILDSLLVEIENRHQPGITHEVQAGSITIVRVTEDLVKGARAITVGGLSLQDKLNLHYVRHSKRGLLTGDGKLRKLCVAEGIPVFGTLWIIDQLYSKKVVSKNELCRWLLRLSEPDRFLPAEELAKRKKQFGCAKC
jgi:hypothetical protein